MRKTYKYLLSLAVVFCFIALIFSFSEQSGTESHTVSKSVSKHIISSILNLSSNHSDGSSISDKQLDSLAQTFDGPVRKLAHVTIYLGLAFIATWLVWFITDYDLRFIHILLIILLVFIVGCSDEAIQYFSGGRGSSFRDVLIDTFGGMLGIYLHFIVRDFFVHLVNGIRKMKNRK